MMSTETGWHSGEVIRKSRGDKTGRRFRADRRSPSVHCLAEAAVEKIIHVKGERYDRELCDIFAVQNEITERLAVTCEQA